MTTMKKNNKSLAFVRRFLDPSIWKFLIVGVANTLLGTTIMFVFYNILHLNYWISSASNYIFGSVLSFFLNKFFTFQSHSASFKEIIRFIINILVCYLIAYGCAQPLIKFLFSSLSPTLQDNISMLFGLVFFTAVNYFGQRFFVFRKTESEGE